MAAEISKLVNTVYESALVPERWSAVAQGLVQCTGAVSCSLQIRTDGTARVVASFGYKDLDTTVYERHFAKLDVRAHALMRLPANLTHAMHHYLPQRDFVASSYYADYFRHVTDGYWSSAWWTPLPKESVFAFGVHRPRGADPDDPAMRKFFAAVTPHLRRSARMFSELSDLSARLQRAAAALDAVNLPVILIGGDGHVSDMNSAAEIYVRSSSIISIDGDGVISAADALTKNALQAAIAYALKGALAEGAGVDLEISLRDPAQPGDTMLTVVPLSHSQGSSVVAEALGHAGAIIIIKRAPVMPAMASIKVLAARFRLTPAEERLAHLLVNGGDLASAAGMLKITRSTASTELRSIFHKTGTHRQAGLVSLALRLEAGS